MLTAFKDAHRHAVAAVRGYFALDGSGEHANEEHTRLVDERIVRESQAEIAKARGRISEIDPHLIASIRHKLVAGMLLQREHDSVLHIERTGLITEKDAEEMLEEYHEDVARMEKERADQARAHVSASVKLKLNRAKLKLRLAIAFGGRTALDDIANRTKAEVEATFERGDTDDRARMLVFDLDEHVSQGGSGIEGTLQDEADKLKKEATMRKVADDGRNGDGYDEDEEDADEDEKAE